MSSTATLLSTSTPKAIFVNLDVGFFDPDYPIQQTLSILRDQSQVLTKRSLLELVTAYKTIQDQPNDKKNSTDEAVEAEKIQKFHHLLDLPAPTPDASKDFCNTYQTVYNENRLVVEKTLLVLRQNDYKIVIIVKGKGDAHMAKINAIGILPLVDRVITSAEAEQFKKDYSVFQYAVEELGIRSWEAFMVGGSLEGDVQGALSVELKPILYMPTHRDSHYFLGNLPIPVIQDLNQLLEFLLNGSSPPEK
ncbi:hypothetical protein F53441_11920 [Fusarium austroafricanum]|uniref:Uncharacterized protein n=1 Tax=Fusarium austroafricanum TaxID=2364996 RepID=A0A8H4JZG7_9HYPO|nr:hypothetical protein F53441_11920 [Fusarium austroafricanum]